jgi:hypothetical protein|tara:strand:- start:12780 stop:13169 length:390 start_codon:yes stop_codon:yes gene_type:complete
MTYVLRSYEIAERCIEKIMSISNSDSTTSTPLTEVVIREHKSKRSVDQNNRYWAILRGFASHTGHTADELHKMMSIEILGWENIKSLSGEEHLIPKQTSSLTVQEFAEYMERVESIGADYGYAHRDLDR